MIDKGFWRKLGPFISFCPRDEPWFYLGDLVGDLFGDFLCLLTESSAVASISNDCSVASLPPSYECSLEFPIRSYDKSPLSTLMLFLSVDYSLL